MTIKRLCGVIIFLFMGIQGIANAQALAPGKFPESGSTVAFLMNPGKAQYLSDIPEAQSADGSTLIMTLQTDKVVNLIFNQTGPNTFTLRRASDGKWVTALASVIGLCTTPDPVATQFMMDSNGYVSCAVNMKNPVVWYPIPGQSGLSNIGIGSSPDYSGWVEGVRAFLVGPPLRNSTAVKPYGPMTQTGSSQCYFVVISGPSAKQMPWQTTASDQSQVGQPIGSAVSTMAQLTAVQIASLPAGTKVTIRSAASLKYLECPGKEKMDAFGDTSSWATFTSTDPNSPVAQFTLQKSGNFIGLQASNGKYLQSVPTSAQGQPGWVVRGEGPALEGWSLWSVVQKPTNVCLKNETTGGLLNNHHPELNGEARTHGNQTQAPYFPAGTDIDTVNLEIRAVGVGVAATLVDGSIVSMGLADGNVIKVRLPGTAGDEGDYWLIAGQSGAGNECSFMVVVNSDKTVSFKSLANNKYVSAMPATNPANAWTLIAAADVIGANEKFTYIDGKLSSANGFVTRPDGPTGLRIRTHMDYNTIPQQPPYRNAAKENGVAIAITPVTATSTTGMWDDIGSAFMTLDGAQVIAHPSRAPFNSFAFEPEWSLSDTVAAFTFMASAKQDVVIVLSPVIDQSTGDTIRTFTLGGYNNTEIIARPDAGGPRLKPAPGKIILEGEDKYAQFWITYDKSNGIVNVGKGMIPGANVLVTWTDPAPLKAEKLYLGVGAWFDPKMGSKVFYNNIAAIPGVVSQKTAVSTIITPVTTPVTTQPTPQATAGGQMVPAATVTPAVPVGTAVPAATVVKKAAVARGVRRGVAPVVPAAPVAPATTVVPAGTAPIVPASTVAPVVPATTVVPTATVAPVKPAATAVGRGVRQAASRVAVRRP